METVAYALVLNLVLEDDFPYGRPALEMVGVTFVNDVAIAIVSYSLSALALYL